MTNQLSFIELRVLRDQGSIYVRDYAGAGRTAFRTICISTTI
jgi:hypothetical protein